MLHMLMWVNGEKTVIELFAMTQITECGNMVRAMSFTQLSCLCLSDMAILYSSMLSHLQFKLTRLAWWVYAAIITWSFGIV